MDAVQQHDHEQEFEQVEEQAHDAPDDGPGIDVPEERSDVDVGGRYDDEGQAAVRRVKHGSTTPEDLHDAMEWFLSSEDSNVRATKSFEVNVSADPTQPKFVRWTVQAIPRERIRQIRRQSRIVTRRGASDETNEAKANTLIAVEGTVHPDLAEIAGRLGTNDVAGVLDRRFAHKPGLIDIIAGEVLSASGYDEDDVRDVAAGKR